jgi:hypothetical protein
MAIANYDLQNTPQKSQRHAAEWAEWDEQFSSSCDRAIVTDGSPPQEPLVSIIGIFFDKTVARNDAASAPAIYVILRATSSARSQHLPSSRA